VTSALVLQFGDNAGNITAKNSSIFSLIQMCYLPSARARSWLRCTVVERQSWTSELSLSHAQPEADG